MDRSSTGSCSRRSRSLVTESINESTKVGFESSKTHSCQPGRPFQSGRKGESVSPITREMSPRPPVLLRGSRFALPARPSGLVGGALPAIGRERGQAPEHTHPARSSLAQTTLVQAAWAATRKKNSYHRAQFQRLKSRRGPKKAIIAVAASMLTAAYHMLRDGTPFEDLGPDHFDRRDRTQAAKRLKPGRSSPRPGRSLPPQ
jgi:hypothetical protein